MRARWSNICEAVVFKVFILGKTSGSENVRGTAIKHCPTRLRGIFRSHFQGPRSCSYSDQSVPYYVVLDQLHKLLWQGRWEVLRSSRRYLRAKARVITPSVDRRERRRMQKDSVIFLERTGEGHVVLHDHFGTIGLPCGNL